MTGSARRPWSDRRFRLLLWLTLGAVGWLGPLAPMAIGLAGVDWVGRRLTIAGSTHGWAYVSYPEPAIRFLEGRAIHDPAFDLTVGGQGSSRHSPTVAPMLPAIEGRRSPTASEGSSPFRSLRSRAATGTSVLLPATAVGRWG